MWEQDKFLHKTHIKTAWERELFYSIMYPPNMTVKWLDTDKPESATYKKDIKYTFNEYGFRSDSFNDRGEINILTCGCSHTVGVGVDQHEAWPFVLKAMLEEKTGKKVVVWNLATSGASPDYVLRSVYKTLQTLKPDYVCVYWPPTERTEMPDINDERFLAQSFLHDSNFPKTYVNERWLIDYVFMKNLVAIEAIVPWYNAKFIANKNINIALESLEGDYFAPDTDARDGLHPGPEWHKRTAEFYLKSINTILANR